MGARSRRRVWFCLFVFCNYSPSVPGPSSKTMNILSTNAIALPAVLLELPIALIVSLVIAQGV
jgi:hypothetical protein